MEAACCTAPDCRRYCLYAWPEDPRSCIEECSLAVRGGTAHSCNQSGMYGSPFSCTSRYPNQKQGRQLEGCITGCGYGAGLRGSGCSDCSCYTFCEQQSVSGIGMDTGGPSGDGKQCRMACRDTIKYRNGSPSCDR
jgi:hypothetical protein